MNDTAFTSAHASVPSEPLPASWMSAHLYYQGPLDLLLRELVVPLVRDLGGRGLLAQHFFLRYWQGGPHLRLRLRPVERDGAPAVVRRAVENAASGVFSKYPSPDHL